MSSVLHPNVAGLLRVARRLGDLVPEVVFLGGATTPLFITAPGAGVVRATKDVDCVIEVASLAAYHALDARLRAKGFANDMEARVACRYKIEDDILDVMPTDPSILGFANRWARDAVTACEEREIGGLRLRVVTSVYFLATKLEAFLTRGRRDMLTSPDLEDIVSVVDGRPELLSEIQAAPIDLKRYFHDVLSQLLAQHEFADAIAAHLPNDVASQSRAPGVLQRLSEIAALPGAE